MALRPYAPPGSGFPPMNPGDSGPMPLNPGAGVPGGPALPSAPSSGMSGMAGAGLLMQLGGGFLDYYGQRQGIKSMQAEAERQAAEQEAFSLQRHQRLASEINRFDPQTQQAFATGALLRSQRATAPALAAGGKALGLSGSAITSAGRSLLPMQRLQATRQGGTDADRVQRERMQALGIDLGAIDDEQQMQGALYPMRSEIAGQKGSGYRLGGGLLQGMAMPAMSYAMAQKA